MELKKMAPTGDIAATAMTIAWRNCSVLRCSFGGSFEEFVAGVISKGGFFADIYNSAYNPLMEKSAQFIAQSLE
jgi:hypothetical protein